jgi:fucose permease
MIFALFFFGLDLFLLGQQSLAYYSLDLKQGWQISVMNSAAFAPIPIMLLISSKVIKKYGFKTSFIVAIITFIVAMTSFMAADHNITHNV